MPGKAKVEAEKSTLWKGTSCQATPPNLRRYLLYIYTLENEWVGLTNHPNEKEHHLPNLHFLGSMPIFQGVSLHIIYTISKDVCQIIPGVPILYHGIPPIQDQGEKKHGDGRDGCPFFSIAMVPHSPFAAGSTWIKTFLFPLGGSSQ